MIYCTKCGQLVDENLDTCPHCGEPLIKRELEYEELRSLNRALHTRENQSREKVDNALVFIVLGTTLLIIGALFFFLSFKMDQETFTKQLSFKTPEFYVSMVGLGVGGLMLLVGLSSAIYEKCYIQKEIKHTLKLTQNNSYIHLAQTSRRTISSIGYLNMNLGRVSNMVLAFFPITSWILGAITRISRGRMLSGFLQLLTPAFLFFWIVDIVNVTTKGDIW